VHVPSVVLPSRNVTVPVAVEGVTVAVKVTVKLYEDGFANDFRLTVVLAGVTACVSTAATPALSFVSPP
jgi:hypothetical protein